MSVPKEFEAMWAFVGSEEGDGIVGTVMDGFAYPMVTADPKRVEKLRDQAVVIARAMGKPIHLVKFTRRELVEVIEPPKKGRPS